MTAELQKLEDPQEKLERQLCEAEAPSAPPIHPALPEIRRPNVVGPREALDAEGVNEAMDLVRSLVEQIVLAPEDGRPRIDLRGEFAAIILLLRGRQKARSEGIRAGYGCCELVAGTGFEPVTFRL